MQSFSNFIRVPFDVFFYFLIHQKFKGGGHYAFTTTVYPDIWVILGDVNQSGQPVYQNVAHEKLLE